MKKYSIYIVTLIIGLLLGWLIFGGSQASEQNHETTESVTAHWTCSMHPHIDLPEFGTCPICGMDLIPVENSTDELSPNQFKMSENAMALANVETTVIQKSGSLSERLVLFGKIKENENSIAVQTAHFSGRIEKLYIKTTGETVRSGQLLALIYSPELVSTQGELLTALEIKESQPELYQAVRNKLKLWKLSEKQINIIETTRKTITNFPVYANVSGVVTTKMIEEGNHIKEGTPLFKIANLNTVWAEFDAYEKQISSIKKGDKISISTNANPSKNINAKISFIDPIFNTATRTVTVRAELNNKNGELKPGMFINGIIETNSKTTNEKVIITIPKTSVLWTGKRSIVYVKIQGEEPVFEMREVILGNAIGNSYEILNGLSENEEIVTNGTFTIDAAAQLQGKKSMMNPKGGKTTTGHEGHLGMKNETSENSSSDTNHSKMNERIKVSNKFQNQFKNVFDEYIKLKNALVEDNVIASKEAANSLVNKLGEVDMKLLKDNEAHKHWMTFEKEIKSSGNAIAGTSEIKNQRDNFKHLSAQMISSIQLFGINQKVYSQFCPMADNNKGAYWLSMEQEIRNPYFGDAMLNCGKVKDTIE